MVSQDPQRLVPVNPAHLLHYPPLTKGVARHLHILYHRVAPDMGMGREGGIIIEVGVGELVHPWVVTMLEQCLVIAVRLELEVW